MSAPLIGRVLLTLTFLGSCVAAATAEQRTWTDNSGKFTVEAEFVAISGGNILLKTASGKTIRVPLERLREADRRYGDSREHAAQQSAVSVDPASSIKASGAWVTVDRLRSGNPIVKVRFSCAEPRVVAVAKQAIARMIASVAHAAGEGLFGSGHEATAAQQQCIRKLRDALALDREPSATAELAEIND